MISNMKMREFKSSDILLFSLPLLRQVVTKSTHLKNFRTDPQPKLSASSKQLY